MRQVEDVYTLDLIDPAPKRGRGRPRKDDALTPAQRASKYRHNKRFKKALAELVANPSKAQTYTAWKKPNTAPAISKTGTYLCQRCSIKPVSDPEVWCLTCWPFPGNGKP